MELSKRIKYFTFLIIGVVFIITGFALNELEILNQANTTNLDDWYAFLSPWVGNSENGGIPVPWEQ